MLPSIELTEAYLKRLSDKAEQLSDLDDVITEVERAIEPLKKLKTGFPAAMMVKDLIADAQFMQDLIYEQRHAINQLIGINEMEGRFEILSLPIESLSLRNEKDVELLKGKNINTLGDLIQNSQLDLMDEVSLKIKGVFEIRRKLKYFKLKLKEEELNK